MRYKPQCSQLDRQSIMIHMIDPAEIVKKLIKSGESEVVEFKSATTDSFNTEKIGKYFSALSNEANLRNKDDAWLCFGIKDDDNSFTNTQFRTDDGKLQHLKIEIGQKTTSGVTFKEICAFEIELGKRVILFRIPPAPQGMPIAFDGHYYAREHDATIPLNIEKIERIRAQDSRSDWSKLICEGATIDDLDSAAIEKARELYKAKNQRLAEEIGGWSDKQFLNKARITIDSKITNAAIILVGKPESSHLISPAVSRISWILRAKDGSSRDYEHFHNPMVLSIDKAYAKIRNLRYRYMQEGSLFPEETDSYDPYVIREALNNCIAHQDYSLGGHINIVENEEEGSLVFTNLGAFLPGSVESVINADAPAEFYRNRFLSEAMVNLNMIDTVGSGIRKMFMSQRRKLFPLPDYDLSGERVRVTIVGKVLDLNYARKLAQIPDLDLNTIILLDKIQK
ncbi:MAG: transcriptional regulator, partial [Gemmatimonadetes bacterium]|nr:transcriptional regulator [Gemmatimonadota bacterium]